jgi:hypothetical protein
MILPLLPIAVQTYRRHTMPLKLFEAAVVALASDLKEE